MSNNDCGVREFDMETFQLLNHFSYNWPVNVSHLSSISTQRFYVQPSLFDFLTTPMQHTSVSPDRKLLAVVGDDRDALLVDSRNGKVNG